MNDRELKELKGLMQEASGELRDLERRARSFVQKEARILKLLKQDLGYSRSYEREIDDVREMSRRLSQHNFLRKVSKMIPDLERELRSDQQVSGEVREDLEDVLVQVGDTQMSLGTLLRALEDKE